MPVPISCPQCNKQYNLPEKFVGKGVQCKKCGTRFVAGQAQPATVPAPNANAGERLSSQQLNQYGIEGNLERAQEIFGEPAPPPGPGLGNFAGEDPGFGGENFQLPNSSAAAADNENPYAAVLANPALRPKKKKKKKRGADRPVIDYDSYTIARYGINSIFYAVLYLLIIGTLLAMFAFLARVSPETVASIIKSISESETMVDVVNFIANIIFKWGMLGNALAILVGQICCIFAPKPNERLNAGLALGLFFGAGVLLLVGIFVMGAAAIATIGSQEPGNAPPGAADMTMLGAIGIGTLIVGLIAFVMVLASFYFFINFYSTIGENIQSPALKQSAHLALITYFASMAASFVLGFLGGFIASLVGESGSVVTQITDVLSFILNMASTCMILLMLKTALDDLTPK